MVAARVFTANELLAKGADQRYELIRGELVELSPTSSESSSVTLRLSVILGGYILRNDLGHVSSAEGGYILTPHDDTVVVPDIGFVIKHRIPVVFDQTFFPIPPDLAVEVVSSSNTRLDLFRKVGLYADAGVPIVWVVYPRQRAVSVFKLDEPAETLNASDTLSAEDILPRFSIPVYSIFSGPLPA